MRTGFNVLLAIAFTMLSVSSLAQTADQLSEQITALLIKGSYTKAVKLHNKLISQFPDSANLYVSKAECLCRGSKPEEAFTVFEQAQKMDSQNPLLYLSRGACFLDYRYYDKAVQDFTDGIAVTDVDSVLLSLYTNRGAAKTAYLDIKGALADNLKALELDSTNIAMHNNLGMTFGEIKEFDKAELHLLRVVELDSTFPGGYMNLGFLYSEMREFEKALAALDIAISKFPDQPFPYNNRGLVKHELGDSKGALKDIRKSLKLYANNSYAHRNLAIVYKGLNQMDKACESCNTAIDLGFTTNYGQEMKTFYTDNCLK